VQEWLIVIALLILFTLAISWLSAIMGLFVKSLEAAQWIGFVLIFPLTFASSAFAPTETMPKYLRIFAENQPVTHVVNATRSWLVGQPALGDSGWKAFGWCIGIILIAMPIAIWIFSRRGLR
jgi:ABC-2 type transport system permease protein